MATQLPRLRRAVGKVTLAVGTSQLKAKPESKQKLTTNVPSVMECPVSVYILRVVASLRSVVKSLQRGTESHPLVSANKQASCECPSRCLRRF